MKRVCFLFVFSLLLNFSCEEVVILDIDELDERIVIEGLITNERRQAFVKITESRDFYAEGPAARVTNATVEVQINGGEVIPFFHNPDNLPALAGYYFPIGGLTGQVGSSYELSVELNGTHYEASETMLPVSRIDSLTTKFNADEFEDPQVPGRYYEVLLNAQEPQDREDQYLFKFYRNDTLVRDFPTDIYVAEDELLGGNIAELEIAGYYALGDVSRVEMYSLTREAFVYYSDLSNLLNGDGGMFSPPPANPRSNISNGALGYFQVSAVDSEELVVYDPRTND